MRLRLYGQPPEQRESIADWDMGRGPTNDRRISVHANTRGRHRTAAPTRRAGSERSPAGWRRLGRRPGRAAFALVTAVVLAGSACSAASETDLADASPTFARANGSGMAFSEPLADVSDLVGPATEDGEWTIVGSVFDPESKASEATVWTSDDARGWERTTVDPAAGGTGESMASALTTDEGIVAVGQVGEGAEADAAVWHQDGDDWRQVRPDAMGGDHEQWAFKVVSGEGGMLVAGGESVWGEIRPRLWFSADGESWKSVDGGADGPFDETGEEAVRDITAVGSGFVAVGSRTLDTQQDGLAWYSPDGETWEAVSVPTMSGPGRQDVRAVVATDGAVVAGGFSDDANGQGQPTIWRSADGRAWEAPIGPLAMTDNRNAASDLEVRSITLGDQGLIAAGGSDWRPRVWRSPDGGVSWEELANPVHGELFQDGVSLVDAVGAQGMTVALAADPAVLLLDPTRWEDATGDSFPRGGEQPFATSVAVGAEGAIAAGGRYTAATGDQREIYTGQIWQRDGDNWKPVETEHVAAGHIMDAVPFAGGFAAVGFEDFGVADGRGVVSDREPDGLVWVSNNGEEWARIGVQNAQINIAWLEYLDNPTPELAGAIAALEAAAPPESAAPAGGSGTRSLGAVAPLQDGFIAVGSVFDAGDANPVIIVSPDGTSYVGEEPVHAGAGIQRYNDVCVAPDGRAVAVGISGAVGAFDAIVATRVEGEGWAVGNGPFTGDGDQQAYACAASDEGFVMVGSDDRSGGTDARVWTSEDGIEWTLVESSLLGGDGDQWASAVAPVPDGGWIVAGTDTAAGDGDIALWRITADGGIFRRDRGEPALGGPGEQTVTNITVDEDDHVLLAGNDYGRVGLWQSDSLDR